MVTTTTMRISVAVAMLAMATTATRASDVLPPAYVIPAVDFTQLHASSHALLDAMQHDGIVALKNIPHYASLRAEYLQKAAECAVHAKRHGAEFLLHRRLQDGTQRYTLSTESGKKLEKSGFETVETCPGYQQVYHKFSRMIETAVASVGRAIDTSKALQIQRRQLYKTEMAQMSAHELMAESIHLDHFHAYEATSSAAHEKKKTIHDLSLEMHTDNGLMIAMTAPEYFDVHDAGDVSSRHTRSEDAGLLIKTAEGQVVRPLLQADELVLMLGEGINTWIHTTPRLQAVTHGMQYPRGLSYADDGAAHKSLRAWFGKMILLSQDHVMANTGLSYGAFANQTTRYLKDAANDKGFAAVACSPHRRLQASDNRCTLKTCSPKAGGETMAETCQVTCNHESIDDAKLCEANCECEDTTSQGSQCWMLCVPRLSEDECTGDQKCNTAFKMGEIALTCAAGATPTTAPTTTSARPSTPSSSSSSAAGSSGSSGSATGSPPTTTEPTTEPSSTPSVDDTQASADESASGSATDDVVGSTKPSPAPSSGATSLVTSTTVVVSAILMISSSFFM